MQSIFAYTGKINKDFLHLKFGLYRILVYLVFSLHTHSLYHVIHTIDNGIYMYQIIFNKYWITVCIYIMENKKYQINNCQIILRLNLIFILIPTWLFYYYNIIIVMCVKVYQCCLRFYEFTIGIYFIFFILFQGEIML